MTSPWRIVSTTPVATEIRALVLRAGVFSPEEIDMAEELAQENIAQGPEASGYHFLLAETPGTLAGYSCYGRVPLTDERYDLYWIATDPRYRKQGLATALLAETEIAIRHLGGKHLYAETSSREPYLPAHAFYLANGFAECAHLKDFYRDGDSKIIYGKTL